MMKALSSMAVPGIKPGLAGLEVRALPQRHFRVMDPSKQISGGVGIKSQFSV